MTNKEQHSKRAVLKRDCRNCGTPFNFEKYRKDVAKFCSRKCTAQNYGKFYRMENHPQWKGGKVEHSYGYYLIKSPDHPFATRAGYVPEHRLVAEKKLGKLIDPKEFDVHHVDGNKKNNDPSNLMVLTHSDHMKVERGWQKISNKWWKPCSKCGKFLIVKNNFYKRESGNFVTQCIGCCAIIYTEKKRRRVL